MSTIALQSDIHADAFDRATVKALFDLPREMLFARADAVRKDNMGDEVFLRGIVEFSNICANDCLYCGIRKSNASSASSGGSRPRPGWPSR
jgi:biotin synthase